MSSTRLTCGLPRSHTDTVARLDKYVTVAAQQKREDIEKLNRIIQENPGLSCIANLPDPSSPQYDGRLAYCTSLMDG